MPVFSSAQIEAARTAARATKMKVSDVLEAHAALEPTAFVARLCATLQYQPACMASLLSMASAFDLISFPDALEHACSAFRTADGEIVIVVADPFDLHIEAWATEQLGKRFTWQVAHRSDLDAFLGKHEETLRAMDHLQAPGATSATPKKSVDELSFKTISEDASPVVQLVHSTLYDALKVGASDVHLETGPQGATVKYRVDGVLSVVGTVATMEIAEQVISRIKVMSELDIAERRVPQDGRFKISVRGREIDFRVSIMPSIFGEDAVLRILDKQMLSDQIRGLRLNYLGFDQPSIDAMRRLSNVPYGMVLVTGPTGSGKTTTLYAAITEVNLGHDKIVTIEDPVEYQLPGVLQIPVNEKKGLTFARGLRSILRHDPDKIMVGEIRDAETAQIAVQSALTGHLVFTTVHANNVFDVIGRFTNMGVDTYSFVSALNGILAQRLIRLNCPHCVADVMPEPQSLIDSGIGEAQVASMRFRRGTGCGQCRGTGFKGRRAIAEILTMNDDIRELIVRREPMRVIKDAARQNGTRFLREVALDMVGRGETTLAEINRVTFVS